jgi:ABC-type amino acid transport substrate-binding protein
VRLLRVAQPGAPDPLEPKAPCGWAGLHRRRILLVALLILVAGALILRAILGYGGTLKAIQERGVWRVGMDPSFPPFENFDGVTGSAVGLDVDLAHAISSRWGIKTEIVSLGFDELVDAVAAHRVDAAISAMPIQPERTEEVRFSDPYVQAGVVLAVMKGSLLAGPADLGGRRVAVEWGSQGEAAARRLLDDAEIKFELLPAETVAAALDALVAGEADAAIVDAISLATYSRISQLDQAGDPLVSDPYVIVVAAGAPDLLKAVNDALRALETDGTLDSIRARWLQPAQS